MHCLVDYADKLSTALNKCTKQCLIIFRLRRFSTHEFSYNHDLLVASQLQVVLGKGHSHSRGSKKSHCEIQSHNCVTTEVAITRLKNAAMRYKAARVKNLQCNGNSNLNIKC